MVKNMPANARAQDKVQSLDREDPLEKERTTHSSILSWEMPWIEESDGLQSIRVQRVGQDRTTR